MLPMVVHSVLIGEHFSIWLNVYFLVLSLSHVYPTFESHMVLKTAYILIQTE